MKSLPRAILCTIGIFFVCFLIIITNPVNREVSVVGWEFNTTRNTSQYILRNNLTAAIMPEHVCDQKSLLVIIVCTAPGNFEARNAIRETWGSERYVLGNNVSLYFLIGKTGNSSVQNDVLLESKLYDDIIQERFVDSYNNLTLKSIAMLKIATSYCINTTKYLLKIDDDIFLNLPLLVKMLIHKNSNENVLLGKMICRARPIKDTSSKWYSPKYMYKGRVYPNYLSGTSYLMSLDVAEKLFNAALSTPIFHLEDVYLTGICARKVDIRPHSHPLFTYRYLPNEPCEFRNLITIHHFTPEHLRDTFTTLKDPNLPGICDKYKPYFSSHNWLLGNILKPQSVQRRNRCE